MITDNKTNTIYFSELLKTDQRFSETAKNIFSVLDSFNAKYKFLPNTKDIWARDFMPIQVAENKFVEYRYDPNYLQGKRKGKRDLKTYPDIVCDTINLKTEKTDIILDGGNVVKSANCVILTDKIVVENRLSYNKTQLTKRLKQIFEVDKVVLIPWDILEKFGHSDGVLKFIDENTVLISGIYKSDKIMIKLLEQNGLNCEFLQFKVKKRDKNDWAYINFLQTKDLILIPKFDTEEDDQALAQIETFYPEYTTIKEIAQVNMTKIAEFGGALNCITWTIKE